MFVSSVFKSRFYGLMHIAYAVCLNQLGMEVAPFFTDDHLKAFLLNGVTKFCVGVFLTDHRRRVIVSALSAMCSDGHSRSSSCIVTFLGHHQLHESFEIAKEKIRSIKIQDL